MFTLYMVSCHKHLNKSDLICIHNLHDPLLEELRVNLTGDGSRFLHQIQLAVFFHCHCVCHHCTNVHLDNGQTADLIQTCDTQSFLVPMFFHIYLFQSLCVDRVVPALHVLSRKFIFAENSNCLSLFAPFYGLDHLIKVGLVAFVLKRRAVSVNK